MDPEIDKALSEQMELIEENNRLIKKIHKSIVMGRFISILYWVVIIGSALGAYYFLQPYVDVVLKAYENIKEGFGAAQDLSSSITEFGSVESIVEGLGN